MHRFVEVQADLLTFLRLTRAIRPFEGTGAIFQCSPRYAEFPDVVQWCRAKYGRPLTNTTPHSAKAAARCTWGISMDDNLRVLFFRRPIEALEFKMRWC